MSSKTIICDIDGCLLHHDGPLYDKLLNQKSSFALQGVSKEASRMGIKGLSGYSYDRKKRIYEKLYRKTTRTSRSFYDVLIMGMPSPRILINDISPSLGLTAYSINLERNTGLSEVEI